ncbi:MAG: glycosyltransferase family 4 protein [Candidatus Nanohaloarchaea archaeon]
MKKVLFTKSRNDYIHKLHRNFIENPVEGFKYVDIDGNNFNTDKPDEEEDTEEVKGENQFIDTLVDRIYTFTKSSGLLIYLQKFWSGRKYVDRIDSSDPDIVYGLNGQYYFGDRPWIVDFEDAMVFAGHNRSALKYRKLMKKSFERENCKAIIAYSETDRRSFLELFGEELEEKVHVSHNVVQQPENNQNIDSEGFKLLFTGSANIEDDFYMRGGREALRAFKKFNEKHPDSELIIRSKIPEEEKHLIEDNSIRVIEDIIPKEEFENLFRKSDVYLHPSYKGCALSIPEAMSFGLPIVGSDVVENDEYIESGVNGYKARADHVKYISEGIPTYYGKGELPGLNQKFIDRLASKIEKIYQNPEKRKKMRHNNIEKSREMFSIEAKKRKLEEVFEKSLQND